jgi:[ribosomal protein S5]-alanine N-acetyltransferase
LYMILFETERYIVRRFTTADNEDFYLINSHPDVMKFIRPVKNKQECAIFLTENIQLYQDDSIIGRYMVIEKKSSLLVGIFSFLYLSDNLNYHIGFALLPAFWGQGIAQELVQQGVGYFFENASQNELFAITDAANKASQNVLLKTGFLTAENTLEKERLLDLFVIRKEAL